MSRPQPQPAPRSNGRRVVSRALRLAGIITLLAPLWVARPSAGEQNSRDSRQGPPNFRAGVNYVEVDITATDSKGQFVRGLTRDDFEVFEDGKRQQVSAFTLMDLPFAPRPPRSTLSTAPVEADVRSNTSTSEARVFVVVLDDLHTPAVHSAQVKAVAREFLQRYVGPNDLVSILHTSGRYDASQEFTPQPSLLLASVDKFLGRKIRSSTLVALEEYQRQQALQLDTQADIRMQHAPDPLEAERARQAEDMLNALERLGDLLAGSGGHRKSVVLISEGMDYDILGRMVQTSSGLSTNSSTYGPSLTERLTKAIAALTRANVAVYGIDPRGMATGGDTTIEMGAPPQSPLIGLSPTAVENEVRRAQDSLRVISEETGGAASVSANDFSNAFDRIMRDNSTYYLLTYYSNDSKADGRLRKIDVRVKRPGVRIRARKGYMAPSSRDAAVGKTADQADVEPSIVLQQVLNNPLPMTGVPLHASVAPFKGVGLNASVVVVLEVDARNFTFEQRDGLYTDRLEAAVVALDRESKFLDGDKYSVDLRLKPETYRIVQSKGVRLLFRLNLPHGRYQVRAAAQEIGSGAVGSIHVDVLVPDFAGEALSESGIVLTSTSAAETPTPRADTDLAALLPTPPTDSRNFTRAETLAAAFAIYHNPSKPVGPVDVATTVAGEDGQVRFSKRVEASEEELRGAPDGYGYVVEIPLKDMPPGEYVLRVETKSRLAAGAIALRQLPFRIH